MGDTAPSALERSLELTKPTLPGQLDVTPTAQVRANASDLSSPGSARSTASNPHGGFIRQSWPSSSSARWQWEHKSGFRDYTPYQSARIERAFQRGDGKVRLKTGKDGTTPMEIFFFDLIQYDVSSKNPRRVRRLGKWPFWMRMRRFIMEYYRWWETGLPFRETFSNYKSRQDRIDRERSVYDVTRLYKQEGICARIATSTTFFIGTMLVVLVNVVWIAIDTDLNEEANLFNAELKFQVMEHTFCVLFLLELMVRFCAFRQKCDGLRDTWFVFDGLLVALMIFETWLLPTVQLLVGGDGNSAVFKNVTIFRLARLMRLTRVSRLLRALPELMTMLKGVVKALRSVLSTLLLEMILLYVFAIFFCTWTRSHQLTNLEPYFKTVMRAALSLLEHGTLLDGPSGPLNDIIQSESPTLLVLFLLFIVLSSFTVLNMLIGILCNMVAEVSEEEKRKNEALYLRYSLLEIFECYDRDNNNTMGKDEFEALMKNPEVHEVLRKFGTDVGDLRALTDVLFEDETDTSQAGELNFEELLEVVLRLRGEHHSHVTDIVQLRQYLRQQVDMLRMEIRHAQMTHLPEEQHRSRIALRLTANGQSKVQLRATNTSIGEVLDQMSARHGRYVAVDSQGRELGPELKLGEIAGNATEVDLQLVPDMWSPRGLRTPSSRASGVQ